MMIFVLILFFVSLVGIIIMIGRKLSLIENGHHAVATHVFSESPFFKEWKYKIIENSKKLGHHSLVLTVRTYVKSANFLKNRHSAIKEKIKTMTMKNGSGESVAAKKEASKFLKTMSELKHKVREIKHKIKEEENL